MEGVKKMDKPLRRLTLRLTPNNPIFTYPKGERNKKAGELLRIGSDIQKLEKAVVKLEKLINQFSNGQITLSPYYQQNDQKEPKDMNLINYFLGEIK